MKHQHIVQYVIIFFLFGATLTRAHAQETTLTTYAKHEVSFGFGGGGASDDDIFEIPALKIKASPDGIFNFEYRYNINPNFSFGFHTEGYSQSISNIEVIFGSTQKTETFDLACNHIGIDGRWIFSRGDFEPFGFFGMNYVGGALVNSDLGTLRMSGFSAGGGGGARVIFSEHWLASAELLAYFGSAKWESKVFSNSTGDSFNPSHYGILVFISYQWGQL